MARVTLLRTVLSAFFLGCSATPHPGADGGEPGGLPERFDAGPAQSGKDAGLDGGELDAGLVANRPYRFKVPAAYDPAKPTPLVILFHGYGSTGAAHDAYFGLSQLADARTFLLATPDGTMDASARRFWNASDACCNYGNAPVDDVAYFHDLVDDVQRRYNVDPRRIFAIGHSNGGFMAHRLACDASHRLAGIASLAGAAWKDGSRCQPMQRLAVLEVHGDQDTTVLYGGGQFGGVAYPSAVETVSGWANRNGCAAGPRNTNMPLDLVSTLFGAETRIEVFDGCAGGAVELWTIQGGSHIPALNANGSPALYDFLMQHPKP
ncbi:MAG: alpha/beta hydrolase family esterase [Myxococcota bacterium]